MSRCPKCKSSNVEFTKERIKNISRIGELSTYEIIGACNECDFFWEVANRKGAYLNKSHKKQNSAVGILKCLLLVLLVALAITTVALIRNASSHNNSIVGEWSYSEIVTDSFYSYVNSCLNDEFDINEYIGIREIKQDTRYIFTEDGKLIIEDGEADLNSIKDMLKSDAIDMFYDYAKVRSLSWVTEEKRLNQVFKNTTGYTIEGYIDLLVDGYFGTPVKKEYVYKLENDKNEYSLYIANTTPEYDSKYAMPLEFIDENHVVYLNLSNDRILLTRK